MDRGPPFWVLTQEEYAQASRYHYLSKFLDSPWADHPSVSPRFKEIWNSTNEAARMTFVRRHQPLLREWSRAWETACASYARSMLDKVLTDNVWPEGVQHALKAALSRFDNEHAAYIR